MKKFKNLINIFYIFSILGLQMFGNLATMIPIFERELINKRNLISKNDLLDSITIGRCGPGAAIINTVVFLGNTIYGIKGGILAAIGFTFYPFITILIISFLLDLFWNENLLNNFFIGVLCSIFILIVKSMINFGKNTLIDKITIGIFISTLVISMFIDIPIIIYIIITGFISYLIQKEQIGKLLNL